MNVYYILNGDKKDSFKLVFYLGYLKTIDMKGEIISTQFKFEVKYEEDGVRKYIHILPETDTTDFEIGMEVEFEIVAKLNDGVTYTTEEGWNESPVEGYYAKIQTEWDRIEEEYDKDEYPVFGGPFNNALTPFEWLKKNYHSPKRK